MFRTQLDNSVITSNLICTDTMNFLNGATANMVLTCIDNAGTCQWQTVTYDITGSNINVNSITAQQIFGPIMTAAQPNITSTGLLTTIGSVGIAAAKWNYLSSMQSISTSDSPTFVTVNANLNGAATSALTVSNNTQNNIYYLPNLTSIQGQSIASSVWPYVNTLNQNVSTTSSPTFNTVSASLTGNVTGTILTATQTNITTVGLLSSIGTTTGISQPAYNYLKTMQAVSTSDSPTFVNITGTILTASQPNITQLGMVNTIGSTSGITQTNWGYVSSMQNVSTTASPTFSNLTSNVTGNVTGNCSGTSAYVTNPTQSAITSLGTLSSLSLANLANITQGSNTLTPTTFGYLCNINQNLGTTNTPAFSALTVNGNLIIKNSSGSTICTINPNTPTVTISSPVTINGHLQVNGDTTYNNIIGIETSSTQIFLAEGNLTNSADAGFYMEYSADGITPIYSGFYRQATSGNWVLYDLLATQPGNPVSTSYTLGNLNCGSLILSSSGTLTIGGNNINSTCLGYLSVINQNLNTTASPLFNAATFSTSITIGSYTINTTNAYNLSLINQVLSTSGNVNFYQLQVAHNLIAANNIIAGGQILGGSGNSSAPSYSYQTYTNFGTYCDGTSLIDTINGTPTVSTNSTGVIPYASNSINLGSSSKYWAYGYFNQLYGTSLTTVQPYIAQLTSVYVSGKSYLPSTGPSGCLVYDSTLSTPSVCLYGYNFSSGTQVPLVLQYGGGNGPTMTAGTLTVGSSVDAAGAYGCKFFVNGSSIFGDSVSVQSGISLKTYKNTLDDGAGNASFSSGISTGNIANPNSATAGTVGNNLYFYQEVTLASISFTAQAGAVTSITQPIITCVRIGSNVTITFESALTWINPSSAVYLG